MNSKTIIFVVILVAVGGGFFLLQKSQSPELQKGIAAPGGVLDLKLKNYNGEVVPLSNFKGKPLVINAWAVWCPFCRKELPDFVTAQKEFGDKVIIIAINRQESLATAKGYTDAQGTSNDLIFLLDPSDLFYQSIGGFSMPETIFVDRDGNIAEHKRGPMDENEIRERVQMLLDASGQNEKSSVPKKEIIVE